MNKVYLHKDNSKIIKYYFLALIPLVIYGIYKNGILLYQKNFINVIDIFRPLYAVLIPFMIVTILKYFKTRKLIIDEETFNYTVIGLFMPPQMSIFFYLIVSGILIPLSFFIKTRIAKEAFCKLIIVLILFLVGKYTYNNLLEENIAYSFSYLDLLWGRSVGGICATSLFYGIISYIILVFSGCYKKEIALISFLVYVFLVLLSLVFIDDKSVAFTNIGGIFIAFVFCGSLNKNTPFMPKARIIYALILGILTFLFSMINKYEGVFFAIIICFFISKYLDAFIYSLKSTK